MDIEQFRRDFPEFSDGSRYPTNLISFWAEVAEKQISADRFGDLWNVAVNLRTAHELVLAVTNLEVAEQCGTPGVQNLVGGITSKTVGSVSVSYADIMSQASEKDAGHWMFTVYGQQYLRLARRIGQGCLQL